MEGKSSTENAEIERFLLRLWQMIMSDVSESVRSFLSPNYRNFAVEWDWNNKISQNVRNLGFFEKKNDCFFLKNELIFFQIGKSGKFAVECVLFF